MSHRQQSSNASRDATLVDAARNPRPRGQGCCSSTMKRGRVNGHLTTTSSILNLSACGDFTDAGLASIAALVQLKHLRLCSSANGYDSLRCLRRPSRFSNMTKTITGAGFASITALVQLKHLDLSKCHIIKCESQANFAPMTQLQFMDLSGSCITDANLESIGMLAQLQHLDLTGCWGFTGAGLAKITPLTSRRPNMRLIFREQGS